MLGSFAVAALVGLYGVIGASLLYAVRRHRRTRWARPLKLRRRDATPLHIQRRLMVLAALKRVRRGLRFPTVAEKRKHQIVLSRVGDASTVYGQ